MVEYQSRGRMLLSLSLCWFKSRIEGGRRKPQKSGARQTAASVAFCVEERGHMDSRSFIAERDDLRYVNVLIVKSLVGIVVYRGKGMRSKKGKDRTWDSPKCLC